MPRYGARSGTGQFDGFVVPDGIGVIRGLRAFNLQNQTSFYGATGKVTGVMRTEYVYEPGLNVAECVETIAVQEPGLGQIRLTIRNGQIDIPRGWRDVTDLVSRLKRRLDHQIAGKGWNCGFYAYVKENQYYYPNNIAGIIEGQGHVTYGFYGFRCEKATIVAMVNPHLVKERTIIQPPDPGSLDEATARVSEPRDMVELFGRWSTRHRFWGKILAPGTAGVYRRRVMERRNAATAHWKSLMNDYMDYKRAQESGKLHDYLRGREVPEHVYALVAAQYPDVKWYATVKEMIAAHPLSKYEDFAPAAETQGA